MTQQIIQQVLDTHDSYFITWKAGTGKSTILREFCEKAEELPHKHIIKLAPTGVAALHIQWVTIHKFFWFPIDITPQKIRDGEFYMKKEYKRMLALATTIVIDEISMVRADLFDLIDLACRELLYDERPFAGKQMVLVWDLFQLPPVVIEHEKHLFSGAKYKSEYFFDSNVYPTMHCTVHELTKVYRQKDEDFLATLAKIRIWKREEDDIEYINNAVIHAYDELPRWTIMLSTTRKRAALLNDHMLNELGEEMHTNDAQIKWTFPNTMMPNAPELTFKKWAQIMMIKNDK